MANEPVELRDPDGFPLLYKTANELSLTAQKRSLRATKIRLVGLLVAAGGGLIGGSFWDLHLGGLLALLAFLTALGAELYIAVVRPDESWYVGRAAAESAKTLTWRYVVRGESFEESNSEQVDRKFLEELTEILHDLGNANLTVDRRHGGAQITQPMRAARSLDFDARRSLYLNNRINDQQEWYSSKARWNAKRANMSILLGIIFEIIGIFAAAAWAFGNVNVDLLGIAAAAAASITAWAQTKQYQNLSTAYGVTAQELASVASEVEAATDEKSWPRLVGESEEAISREHTLWRASRGIRMRPARRGGSSG